MFGLVQFIFETRYNLDSFELLILLPSPEHWGSSSVPPHLDNYSSLTLLLYKIKIWQLGWRGGLRVKNTHCSYRGLVPSTHIWQFTIPVALALWDLVPNSSLPTLRCTYSTHTHNLK